MKNSVKFFFLFSRKVDINININLPKDNILQKNNNHYTPHQVLTIKTNNDHYNYITITIGGNI